MGFSVQRELVKRGCECDAVAPAGIPRRPCKAVKSDRIDAADRAQYDADRLLTVVAVPGAQVEQDRNLLRSRQQLVRQPRSRAAFASKKWCAVTFSRCCGATACPTRARPNTIATDTRASLLWWERTVAASSGSLKVKLSPLLRQLRHLEALLVADGQAVEAQTESAQDREPVKALTCDWGSPGSVAGLRLSSSVSSLSVLLIRAT